MVFGSDPAESTEAALEVIDPRSVSGQFAQGFGQREGHGLWMATAFRSK